MRSKRSNEGYFFLDNRGGPGLPEEFAVAAGLPAFAGRGLFEAPSYTCSHCQAVVIMEPKRTRERAFCAKCNHYICDACGVVKAQTMECKTFNQIIEETQERAVREEQRGIILLS